MLIISDLSLLFLGISVLSLLIWFVLIFFWGYFWRTDQQLEAKSEKLEKYPSICVIIPARNEAECLSTTLASILAQDYPGFLSVILVDDRSTDDTAKIALKTATKIPVIHPSRQFKLLTAEPLPLG